MHLHGNMKSIKACITDEIEVSEYCVYTTCDGDILFVSNVITSSWIN